MRSFLVGLFLLAISAPAFGQAAGFVEKIGFGKAYRPYGWTPLLVNLTSTIGEPAEYQIQVVQEDLDRDRVTFRRDIVLNPNKQEQFWVYFLAQPRGLGDGSVGDLDKLLDVRLCTKGGKPLAKLKINDPLMNLDPPRGGFGAARGSRLVLMVTDGSTSRSTPALREFTGTVGMNEDIAPVLVTPFDLPENVLGYDAVDAVVWLDADAGKMTSGGSRRMAALTDWVRSGGRLVVCQPIELFKLEEMLDILPVQGKSAAGDWLIELRDRRDLNPLRGIASHRDGTDRFDEQQLAWDALETRGPFKVAHGKLRDDAVGEEWIDWTGKQNDMSPWLARRALGLGSVTWVAQDLGNPVLISNNATGWPRVWDRVLGQRNTDMRVDDETRGTTPAAENNRNLYYANAAIDVGSAFLSGMEHEGRAGGLIFLAGVFFVGYWVIAGPVSYLVLLGKKRTELSWSAFAVSALGATLLTVGVVRLVLRGGAEVHHVSLVRMLPAGRNDAGVPVSHTLVNSRIGLYIPRSGDQGVTLLENDPQGLSYITPFSVHPAHYAVSSDFPAYLTYTVPVRDNPLTEAVAIEVPYRRTLKKIQARWAGQLSQGVDVLTGGAAGTYEQNQPRLVPREKAFIGGRLVNRSGTDLAHVHFVFNYPPTQFGDAKYEDFILYVPSWPDGKEIDLNAEYARATPLALQGMSNQAGRATPGGNNAKSVKAFAMSQWVDFWYSGLRATGMSDSFDDARNDFLRSFPIVSLYDRIPPQQNKGAASDRIEVLRRAAREWDVSELVAAGQLVVLAQGGTPGAVGRRPLPIPMDVEGERVTGTGTTFYQFALPLDRSELPPPWTRPEDEAGAATAPTTAPDVEAAPQVEN